MLLNKIQWQSTGLDVERENSGLIYMQKQLEDPRQMKNVHFILDTKSHPNMMKKTWSRKGRNKLRTFTKDVERDTLSDFLCLREFKEGHNYISGDHLQSAIIGMQAAYGERVSEFRKRKKLYCLYLPHHHWTLAHPFNINGSV